MTSYYTRRVMPNQVRPGMYIDEDGTRRKISKVTMRACSKRGMHIEIEGSKLVTCYSQYLPIRVTITRKDDDNARTQGNKSAGERKNQESSGRPAKGKAATKGRRGNSGRRQGSGRPSRNGGKGTPRS